MEIQSFQRSDLQYLLSYECRMQILHDPPLYFLNGILVWQCAQNRGKGNWLSVCFYFGDLMGVLTCFLIFLNPQWGQNIFEVEFLIFQIILSNLNFNVLFINLNWWNIFLHLIRPFINLLPLFPLPFPPGWRVRMTISRKKTDFAHI